MDTDIDDLMEQVRQQQERVERTQREVEEMEITASSPNGEVTVRLCGSGEFTDVSIDPRTMQYYDADTVGSLVLEAVNNGLTRLGEATQEKFAPLLDEVP